MRPGPTFDLHRGPETYGFTIGWHTAYSWWSLVSLRWWGKDRILAIFVRGFRPRVAPR